MHCMGNNRMVKNTLLPDPHTHKHGIVFHDPSNSFAIQTRLFIKVLITSLLTYICMCLTYMLFLICSIPYHVFVWSCFPWTYHADSIKVRYERLFLFTAVKNVYILSLSIYIYFVHLVQQTQVHARLTHEKEIRLASGRSSVALSMNVLYGDLSNFSCCFPWPICPEGFFIIFENKFWGGGIFFTNIFLIRYHGTIWLQKFYSVSSPKNRCWKF